MGMVKTLRPSSMMGRCDQCKVVFDPVYGGVCARCGQLLCGKHIFGSIWRRLRSYVGGELICLKCRGTGKVDG